MTTATAPSDVTAPLVFVDPAETDPTYRVTLWAAPGEGKSVAAASAPAPILVLSADRPLAYRFARRHHGHTPHSLREVRYQGPQTLVQVFAHLKEPDCDVKTVVVDPVSNIVDQLADIAPANREGGPDYAWVNKQVLRFVKGLRAFDVNVVLVAHEKVNDNAKSGDGKMYPELGGMGLINKLLREMDIVARIGRVVRTVDEEEEELWVAQLQPRGNLVCKESTGMLGDRRVANLSRWFEVANEGYAQDNTDIPFDVDPPDAAAGDPVDDPTAEDGYDVQQRIADGPTPGSIPAPELSGSPTAQIKALQAVGCICESPLEATATGEDGADADSSCPIIGHGIGW